MVVDELTKSFNLIKKTEKVSENHLLYTLTDVVDHKLTVSLAFFDDVLSIIYFLNNQYFEVDEQKLIEALRLILEGKYRIKKSFFSEKKWIYIDKLSLGPERIDKSFKEMEVYNHLPRPFSKK